MACFISQDRTERSEDAASPVILFANMAAISWRVTSIDILIPPVKYQHRGSSAPASLPPISQSLASHWVG